jgi:hypothetical protein
MERPRGRAASVKPWPACGKTSLRPPIIATKSRSKLDCNLTEIDAVACQRLAAASADIEELRAAAQLYRGQLLADLEIRDPAVENWLGSERRRFST